MMQKSNRRSSPPRSVISYVGGKHALINQLIPIIEYAAHVYKLKSYYELCGGGARMLLNLPFHLFPHQKVYNEIDLRLCNLFACCGTKPDVYNLMALLEDLGVGESVFLQAKGALAYENKMLEKGSEFRLAPLTSAAYTFILYMQSRAAMGNSFDTSLLTDKRRLRRYAKRINELHKFYPALADADIINGDVIKLLDAVGQDATAFGYLDPPYVPDVMLSNNHYGQHSWSKADHVRLVDRLLGVKMKIALSGYDNPLYQRLELAGWQKLYLRRQFIGSSATSGRYADEYVWINFPLPTSLQEQITII